MRPPSGRDANRVIGVDSDLGAGIYDRKDRVLESCGERNEGCAESQGRQRCCAREMVVRSYPMCRFRYYNPSDRW